MRTCTTFPWKIENGKLAISADLDRDEQDIIAVVFTRIPERIMRPYTAGTPDFTFRSTTVPDLIAKKLAIAVEEQCPTIARCIGLGRVSDQGTVIVELYWTPKQSLEQQSILRFEVIR
jgi:hypothetical protein